MASPFPTASIIRVTCERGNRRGLSTSGCGRSTFGARDTGRTRFGGKRPLSSTKRLQPPSSIDPFRSAGSSGREFRSNDCAAISFKQEVSVCVFGAIEQGSSHWKSGSHHRFAPRVEYEKEVAIAGFAHRDLYALGQIFHQRRNTGLGEHVFGQCLNDLLGQIGADIDDPAFAKRTGGYGGPSRGEPVRPFGKNVRAL